MTDLVFPATLKPIVSKNYGQTRGSNIWRSEVLGGLPRQGRDTYYEPVPISVTLILSGLGRQVFWNFIRQIDGGASSFQMNHDTGNGVEPHNVMITSTISESTSTGTYWTIQFTATAERTSIQEDSEFGDVIVDLFSVYGDGLNAFIDYYAQYVTTPQFINNLPEAS